ncbi:MAG: 3-isopropylmalate dehydratase small subunit [Paracoccaceae bacterium]
MAGWTTHTGQAIALPLENVDTDQLIPARFMSIPRSEGYGGHLLHDMRRNADGELDTAFPLNRWPEASILIARRNFGSGSSREAAVYALVDAGYRAVIAPSFGDIFAGNAVNNGLLPAQVSESEVERLISSVPTDLSVDLEACTVRIGGADVPFSLADTARTKLMNGWDDIDLTRAEAEHIKGYRDALMQARPWVWA